MRRRVQFPLSDPTHSKPAPCRSMRRGAVAVETAFLAPFLCLLLVIAVDFGRIFYYQMAVNDCAHNGALFGSNLRSYQETTWVRPYTTATQAALAEGSTLNPDLDASQVSVASGKGSDGNANVTVTVNYTFMTVTQFPGFPGTYNLQGKCSMRVAP